MKAGYVKVDPGNRIMILKVGMTWIKLRAGHFKDFLLLAFGSVLNVGKAGNSHFYIQKVNLDVGSFFTSAGILVKDFQ